MNDPGPLRGPDISGRLRHLKAFGVTGATAPDGVSTIEFTTDPAVHGAHGEVRPRFGDIRESGLAADVSWSANGRVMCRSVDSIRVWGSFSAGADVVIHAPGAVRLVARSADGAVLAGPVTISPELAPPPLAW